jgi:tetratricopeptide (TPR) repeat protein
MRLLRDIADALMHAHEAGVVHRDLKPENVLCSGDHAFLLDFGIAQWADGGEQRITGAGLAIGTPRYMAPEQASGQAVDHRADLYAWGIVGREMLLGPLAAELDLSAERPDVPSSLVVLVERCLRPDPQHRPRSAGTLVAALDSIMSGGSEWTPDRDRPPVPIKRAGIRLGGWMVAAATVAIAMHLLTRVPSTVGAGDLRMPIAVAPFREETADSGNAIRGRLAAAWITQGLHETGLFQVVPWPAVLQATEGAGDALAALREQLGVGTVVTGSFFETQDALSLQVEVREARRGTLLAALEPVAVHRDSSALAIRLVRDRVMGALAARRDPRFAGVAQVLERPPTFESYRAFERALAQFNAQRYRESIPGFRSAFELDSGFISPIVYAAQAAWNTAQLDLLDSLLTTLDARRGELTDYHDGLRVFLRAVYSGDAQAAFDAASRAAAIAPQSRGAFDAAVVALWLGRPDLARARFEALDPDRGAMIGWPSYWTNVAHARHLTGHHDRELEAARQMRRRHPTTRVAWTLEARSLAAHLGSLSGGSRETRAAAERVLDSLMTAADTLSADEYWSLGSMLAVAGDELAAHGDTLTARRYHERAVKWLRARLSGDARDEDHLFWLGTSLHQLGRYPEALAVFARQRRLLPNRRSSRELEALAAERAGHAGALAALTPPASYELAERLVAEARLAASQGDAPLARERMRAALRAGYRRWPWLHGTAWRDFAAVRGDTALARLVGLPPG